MLRKRDIPIDSGFHLNWLIQTSCWLALIPSRIPLGEQTMRNKSFAVLILALFTGLAAAQTTSVKGKVTDREGKPMEGAKVMFRSLDDGTKYDLKVNKKGEYFSLGIK